ncbi:electron transfer flavoprotein alpha-subunit [Scheffersomyces xylosifermentans]|uniref:electron transfer flavoprotein alpha-subunit n=1 Tax=Scheffersomyces xylosifermentans TaxID=1304137 RepID=UPI00315CC02F
MLCSTITKRLFSTSITRLETLAFIESSGAKISPASLSSVTAAKAIGKPITALIAGPHGAVIASDVAKVDGISKIILAKGDQYDHYLAEELSPLIKELLDTNTYTHFVIPASAVGKSVLPRVGALVDAQPISDIVKVESEDTFVRPIYAGNALSTVKSNDKLILTSVRASAFAPAPLSRDAPAPLEEYTASNASGNRTEFVSEDLVTSERPELGSAGKVVAGGRGLKNKETFEALIEPLATKLNAAVGASRAAVDSGFCDNSLQVGQTGKIVAPDLYIAIGISGAIQHLAGMKDSKTIVAINKDPEAPIFNVADIGLVADLTEVVPELTQKL